MAEDATTDYEVTWRGHAVGTFTLTASDMWYLEGNWQSLADEHSRAFGDLASLLEPSRVIAAPAKGTAVTLVRARETPIDALVLGLTGGKLSLRQVADAKARDWLRKNVK